MILVVLVANSDPRSVLKFNETLSFRAVLLTQKHLDGDSVNILKTYEASQPYFNYRAPPTVADIFVTNSNVNSQKSCGFACLQRVNTGNDYF